MQIDRMIVSTITWYLTDTLVCSAEYHIEIMHYWKSLTVDSWREMRYKYHLLNYLTNQFAFFSTSIFFSIALCETPFPLPCPEAHSPCFSPTPYISHFLSLLPLIPLSHVTLLCLPFFSFFLERQPVYRREVELLVHISHSKKEPLKENIETNCKF